MDQTVHLPIAPVARTYRRSFLRTVVMGIFLTALAVGSLYMNTTLFPELVSLFTDIEHPGAAWLARELGYWLPFIVIAVFQYAVYRGCDRGDGILEREMARSILVMAALVYLVLLPHLYQISEEAIRTALAAGEELPTFENGHYRTVFWENLEWFVRFLIPVGALYLFHSSRATREHDEAAAQSE